MNVHILLIFMKTENHNENSENHDEYWKLWKL